MARDAELTNDPQVTIELRFLSGSSRESVITRREP